MKMNKILGLIIAVAMMFSTMNFAVFANETAAGIATVGGDTYTTLQAAVTAAKAGDTVTVSADISDEAVTVDKNLTITGSTTLNNVSISGSSGIALTVSGLKFTGNSWVNSGYAASLTVSDVTANVTPANTAATNSRAGFISLGNSEHTPLELMVENCNIVVSGGGDPIIGWAPITKATISGNTFGSAESYQTNSDSVKFMSIADGAVFYITGNTVYSNYNGFVFGQNTTRNNAYTVIVDDNDFYGSADHIWVEVSGANTTHATVQATSDNTVNGNAFTVDDIKTSVSTWTSYAGVDVVTDNEGKVIGGTLASFSAEDAIAEGYEIKEAGIVEYALTGLEGKGTEDNPYLIGSLDELKWFRDDVNAGNTYSGEYVKLTADINLEGSEDNQWTPIGDMDADKISFKGTFDGDNHTISNLYICKADTGLGFFGRTGSFAENEKAVVKNVIFNNVDVSATILDHWTTGHGDYVGGVIANSSANTYLENVHVKGDVYIVGCGYVGGIIGHGYPKLNNCSVEANEGSYLLCYYWCAGGIVGYGGEGGTKITNSSVSGLDIWSDYGAAAAVCGLAQTGAVGENLTAANVDISSNSDYVMGYVFGNGEEGALTNITVTKVTSKANGKEISSTDAVAKIGNSIYFSLEEAFNAAVDGDTVTLLRNIALDKSIVVSEKNITFDGNGCTIKQAEGLTLANYAAPLRFDGNSNDITAYKYIVKNVVFDGWTSRSVLAMHQCSAEVENITIKNTKWDKATQEASYGLLYLENTEITIKNSTFKDNDTEFVVTYNYGSPNSLANLAIDNCEFSNNKVGLSTAAVYYVTGSSCTITNSEFVGNNVTTDGNGAILYLEYVENCKVNGCLFKDNNVNSTGTSTQVAGAIFFEYDADISDNVFENNLASNANGDELGQDVCTSVYYTDIDLSGNYWGGEEPSNGTHYFVQHTTTEEGAQADLILKDYYTSYSTDENGNIVLSDLATVKPYIFGVAFHIINMEKYDDANYQVGLFAGIDHLKYKEVGFKVLDMNGNLLGKNTTRNVYDAITAGGTTISAADYGVYQIFGLPVIVPIEWDGIPLMYQPFAIDMEGNEILGYTYTIDDVYTK